MKKVFLHIGTHKTGSTSVQKWLRQNTDLLARSNYEFYEGAHNFKNHVELYLASMRYERNSFAKIRLKSVQIDENYTSFVGKRVNGFIRNSKKDNLVLSTEGLSLLRHADELMRLGEILQAASAVKVVVYLRNKADFMNSYRKQISKIKNRAPETDYWSGLYVEDDTWLTDYDSLIQIYGSQFGHENMCVIDYDAEMRSKGNVLPSFLQAIGIEHEAGVEHGFDRYYENKTTSRRKEA